MNFTNNDIIKLHGRIVQFGNENFAQIEKLKLNLNNEIESTFVGMILRQITINNDLALLMQNKNHRYHTSELVLLRCLIDDYIHLTYIVNQPNVEEVIVNFNADALDKNFKKINDLAILNEENLGGNYPFYPTYASMEKVKDQIKNSPKRQQHFLDKDNFKFKTFKNTGQIVRELNVETYSHTLRRAYFIWRKLSDFVHYSNITFEEEQMIEPKTDSTYIEFAEIIGYSYFTVLNCLKQIQNNYAFEIIDTNDLSTYYLNAEHSK